MKEREPPDSWEMEFSEALVAPQPTVQKPWKGAAGLIPKTPDITKRPMSDSKEVENCLRSQQNSFLKKTCLLSLVIYWVYCVC